MNGRDPARASTPTKLGGAGLRLPYSCCPPIIRAAFRAPIHPVNGFPLGGLTELAFRGDVPFLCVRPPIY
jgi:hypothetical protein